MAIGLDEKEAKNETKIFCNGVGDFGDTFRSAIYFRRAATLVLTKRGSI